MKNNRLRNDDFPGLYSLSDNVHLTTVLFGLLDLVLEGVPSTFRTIFVNFSLLVRNLTEMKVVCPSKRGDVNEKRSTLVRDDENS